MGVIRYSRFKAHEMMDILRLLIALIQELHYLVSLDVEISEFQARDKIVPDDATKEVLREFEDLP